MAQKTKMKVLKNFLFHGNMVRVGETISVDKNVVHQYELNELAETIKTIKEKTETKNLEENTVRELKEMANIYGISTSTRTKKKDLVEELHKVENKYLTKMEGNEEHGNS